MEILGFGLPEIILILLLALVIMGPEDMAATARKLARTVYRFFRSPQWREFIGAAEDIRQIPRQLMREASMEEEFEMLRQAGKEFKSIAGGINQQAADAAREAKDELRQAAEEITPPEDKI